MSPERLTQGERAAIREEAVRLLVRNRRTGVPAWGGRSFDFVCPSPDHYPFQWFWDSCFHAIALSHFDVPRAVQELRGLVSAARPDGFIPHMILWDKATHIDLLARYNIRLGGDYWTATIQPPVIATALERVYLAGCGNVVLDELLPACVAFYSWLRRERDPDDDGLIATVQPDESGLDSSPKYDDLLQMPTLDQSGLRVSMARLFDVYAPLRGCSQAMLERDIFNVEDVLVNSIYIQGLEALARLCREAGAVAEAREAESAAARSLGSLVSKCWSSVDGAFWDLAGRDENPLRVLTVTSLMPLILGELPRDIARVLAAQLLNEKRFWLKFPVPSVAATEPSFEPSFESQLIWRGPTWVNTNWFLVGGLRAHGFVSEALELSERTLKMIGQSGFREFFNPHTGEGYGATSFGWSTLALELLDQRS